MLSNSEVGLKKTRGIKLERGINSWSYWLLNWAMLLFVDCILNLYDYRSQWLKTVDMAFRRSYWWSFIHFVFSIFWVLRLSPKQVHCIKRAGWFSNKTMCCEKCKWPQSLNCRQTINWLFLSLRRSEVTWLKSSNNWPVNLELKCSHFARLLKQKVYKVIRRCSQSLSQ